MLSNRLNPDVRSHRDEFLQVLKGVYKDMKDDAAGFKLKRFPSRFSPSIWCELIGKPVDEWCIDPEGVNNSIRKIHDFYGWMAKPGARGVCAGTLYRSVEFMKIKPQDRDGTKGVGRNVHIEHTVPVQVLKKALTSHISKLATPADLHRFLMDHSVCVALSKSEEKSLTPAGVPSSRSPAFNERSGLKVDDYPFRRYEPLLKHLVRNQSEFRIINIVSGEDIDLHKFSFDDHIATLEAASSMITGQGGPSLYSLYLFNSQHSPRK